MVHFPRLSFIASLWMVCWVYPVHGLTYFINPASGSNSNSGLTLDQPFKSLTFAALQVLPGSTLRLSEGVYSPDTGEVFTLPINRPMSIVGEGPDKTILLNPAEIDTINFGSSTGASSIQDLSIVGGFAGLTFAAIGRINSSFHARNVLVQGVSRTGILVRSPDTLIEDCVVTQNRHVGIEYLPETSGQCRIERCVIIGNSVDGITSPMKEQLNYEAI